MDITVYLPDDLAQRAKAKPRGFISGVLRATLEAKFAEEDAMKATLGDAGTVTLELTTDDGHPYRGRMTATLIAEDPRTGTNVYLRQGGEVIAYRLEERSYRTVEDPQRDLADILPTREYIGAMGALGIVPEVDLDAEPPVVASPRAAAPPSAGTKGRRLRSVPGDLVVEPSVNLLKRLTGHGDATVDLTLPTPAPAAPPAPPETALPAPASEEPSEPEASPSEG